MGEPDAEAPEDDAIEPWPVRIEIKVAAGTRDEALRHLEAVLDSLSEFTDETSGDVGFVSNSEAVESSVTYSCRVPDAPPPGPPIEAGE